MAARTLECRSVESSRRAMTEPPVIVLHLYSPKARKRILNRLKAQRRPDGTEVYLGSYNINPDDIEVLKQEAIPNVHYAPTFHLAANENLDLKAARPRPPGAPHCSSKELDGPIPKHPQHTRIAGGKNPHAWGVELGRRFRDTLRNAEKKHKVALHWQLDEIPPECGTSKDARLFVGGVIVGLAKGRPKLGDKPQAGLRLDRGASARQAARPSKHPLGRQAVLGGRRRRDQVSRRRGVPRVRGRRGRSRPEARPNLREHSHVRRCALPSTRSALHRRHDPRVPRALRRGSPWQCQTPAARRPSRPGATSSLSPAARRRDRAATGCSPSTGSSTPFRRTSTTRSRPSTSRRRTT